MLGYLTAVPLALSDLIVGLARRFCWLRASMDIFNCKITSLNSLTSLLAFSCTANKSVGGWCSEHDRRTGLSRSVIDAESEVA